MKVMILAAGKGVRMRPLTDSTPKPLLKVAGKPLIVYHIERCAAAGLVDIIINVSHLGQQLCDVLGNGERWGVNINYSREAEPLETAGGIIRALPLLGNEAFVCVNGDIWTDFDFKTLPRDKPGGGHLVLVENPTHHPKGDFALRLSDGLGPSTVVNSADKCLTFSGISVLHPSLFVHYTDTAGPLGPILRLAIDEGQITGERYNGYWCDVGTPDRLDYLHNWLVSRHQVS